MAQVQESSWDPVSGRLERPIWVDGWVGISVSSCSGETQHKYMGIRSTVSIKYEAQLVICKDVSSFVVVENHLKTWEKTMVRNRGQAMQRKAVQYSISTASCSCHRSRRRCAWNMLIR